MQAYTDYLAGKLTDQIYDERELAMALAASRRIEGGRACMIRADVDTVWRVSKSRFGRELRGGMR